MPDKRKRDAQTPVHAMPLQTSYAYTDEGQYLRWQIYLEVLKEVREEYAGEVTNLILNECGREMMGVLRDPCVLQRKIVEAVKILNRHYQWCRQMGTGRNLHVHWREPVFAWPEPSSAEPEPPCPQPRQHDRCIR